MSKNTEPLPLACEDPKFPPIHTRSFALHGAGAQELINWAARLGVVTTSKEAAIFAILQKEFGEKAAAHYRESICQEDESFLDRRRRAIANLGEAEREVVENLTGQPTMVNQTAEKLLAGIRGRPVKY